MTAVPAHPRKEVAESSEQPECWICSRVFGRERQATTSCVQCRRGFCVGEHGKISEGSGVCVICSELEEHAYECACNWLENAAKDPHVPVGFDTQVNEYYVERRNDRGEVAGQMVVRFCPFCGGAPPPSIRDSLFEYVTSEEYLRLTELTKSMKTISDVLAGFGEPSDDLPCGFAETTPEKDGQPARTINYRVLRYENLSPTALVDVIVQGDDRVRFSYITKPRAKHEG